MSTEDRKIETIDGVDHIECMTCRRMKRRGGFNTQTTMTGSPPPHCKSCVLKRQSESNHVKIAQTKRRQKLASAEIPPPSPEFEVPPDRVAQGRRLGCPHCRETALREPANGRPGFATWLVTCAYCDQLNQLVEVAADGSARSIPRRAVDEPGTRKDAIPLGIGETFANTNSAVFRPYCKAKGCGARAEEYGLCSPHLSRCRMAKRLGDVDAWVAEVAPPPVEAPKAVKRKPRPAKKVSRPASGPCQVIDCERPATRLDRRACHPCASRWFRVGRPDLDAFFKQPIPSRKKGRRICRAEGCAQISACRETLCSTHRHRWHACVCPEIEGWLASGAPTATKWFVLHPENKPTPPPPPSLLPTRQGTARADACEVDGCQRVGEHGAGGRLCTACHGRWDRQGKPALASFVQERPPRANLQALSGPCRVPGCPRTAKYKAGLCIMHGGRWFRAGKPAIEGWLLAGGLTAKAWHERTDEHATELAGEAKCS